MKKTRNLFIKKLILIAKAHINRADVLEELLKGIKDSPDYGIIKSYAEVARSKADNISNCFKNCINAFTTEEISKDQEIKEMFLRKDLVIESDNSASEKTFQQVFVETLTTAVLGKPAKVQLILTKETDEFYVGREPSLGSILKDIVRLEHCCDQPNRRLFTAQLDPFALHA